MTKDKSQLTPEMLVPRLGEALVRDGHIIELDLQKGLAYQQEQVAQGKTMLLGQALLDLNLIDRSTLDQAVTEQIIQLRSALQAANRTLERRVHERTAELEAALQRLSELSQMKANFVANISHELRTPLTHIKGYMELMVTDSLGPLTEEQRHALQVSQKASDRLENLIEDLIMFSMASHGELSLKQEPLDIRRLANMAARNATQKAEERGVSMQVMARDQVPMVQGDSEKIVWVLNQLLDNAVKFTPSGGRSGPGSSRSRSRSARGRRAARRRLGAVGAFGGPRGDQSQGREQQSRDGDGYGYRHRHSDESPPGDL